MGREIEGGEERGHHPHVEFREKRKNLESKGKHVWVCQRSSDRACN